MSSLGLHTIVGGFFEFKKPLVLVILNILEFKNHQFDYSKTVSNQQFQERIEKDLVIF